MSELGRLVEIRERAEDAMLAGSSVARRLRDDVLWLLERLETAERELDAVGATAPEARNAESRTVNDSTFAAHIKHWLEANQKRPVEVMWARFPLGMVGRWIGRAETAEAALVAAERRNQELESQSRETPASGVSGTAASQERWRTLMAEYEHAVPERGVRVELCWRIARLEQRAVLAGGTTAPAHKPEPPEDVGSLASGTHTEDAQLVRRALKLAGDLPLSVPGAHIDGLRELDALVIPGRRSSLPPALAALGRLVAAGQEPA